MTTRRAFLGGAATVAAVTLRTHGLERIATARRALGERSAQAVASDEAFWTEVRRAFEIDDRLLNLNNAGVSPPPRAVRESMARWLELSGRAPSHTLWELAEPRVEAVRQALAAAFGCAPDELAVTRNSTEGLVTVQLGLELRRGDEVLTTTHDYPRMKTAWEQRARREGIVVRQLRFPLPPPSLGDLFDRFQQAITPRTRVMLVSHLTNLTGQVFPVRELARLARERGLELIVDGAQAFGHLPFTVADLDCDYYATSLHKWLMAPHGTGFLYVRRAKIEGVWPLFGAPLTMAADIRKFEEIGTHPAANHNAIAEALALHQALGAESKAARLRYLRDRWMRRLQASPRVRVLTSFDPAMSCGIGTIQIEGIAPHLLARRLFESHRIVVTPLVHPEFDGIRVTAGVHTSAAEIDRFADVMEDLLARGLPPA
jgi:selenocysteine lyase/cysteine desulfurase